MRQVQPIPCTWEGVTLHVVELTDRFGRQWVRHSFPGADRIQVEDTGQLPAEFRIRAVVWGEDWFSTLEALRDRVELPLRDTVGAFDHPYWGRVVGVMASLTITHQDEQLDFAVVELDFVEARVVQDQDEGEVLRSASAQAAAALADARAALAELEGA